MNFNIAGEDLNILKNDAVKYPQEFINSISTQLDNGLDIQHVSAAYYLMSFSFRTLKNTAQEEGCLKLAIENAISIEDKIRALVRRGGFYIESSKGLESYLDLNAAEEIVEKNNFTDSELILSIKITKFYLYRSSSKNLINEKLFQEIEDLIGKSNNKFIIAHYYKAKGLYYFNSKQYENTIFEFENAVKFFTDINNYSEIGLLDQFFSICKYLIGDETYIKHKNSYQAYLETSNDPLLYLRYLISLSNSSINPISFTEIPLETFISELNYCTTIKDWKSASQLYSSLAEYYESKLDFRNATESYKKQIEYNTLALKNSDEAKMAEMRFESEIRKIQDENSKVRLMFEELSRLQDKNKSIERFMSHDFLGPSRTIADLCKVLMLSDTQNLTPKGKETLRLIIDAGDMLAEMTGSVWEFMHINEKEGSTFKVFNTEQAIRASFKKFETELRQNNIMYDIKPPFANILGNSDLLTEAINSLISNSIKYCKQPGAVIRIFCEVDRGNAVITYYDNSKGMNWDVLQRVYNLIGNSDRTGMGNGLALLKNVVELHGGSVKLASGNKEGVSFRLIFPVRTKIILFRRMAQEPENIWSIWKEVHALEEQEKEEVRRFQIEKWGRTFE